MKKTLLICIMCLVAALCLCLSACNPEHTHSFTSGDYKSTASGHSQKCTGCDEYGEEEAHNFGADGKCTVCGFEHTHNFTADDFQQSETGHKQKCTDCNQYGPEQAHTFGTDGKKCTVCGYEKKDTEPTEHTHHLTNVPAKEPTCTAEGNIEYYTCDGENCKGKYFDANGRELEEKSIVREKLDHDFSDNKFEITKDGHKQKCKNCNTYSDLKEHVFGDDGICDVCGYDSNTKEDLDLPDNLDGEYENSYGAKLTIKGTSIEVKMSDQVQQPTTYTITGYDEDGKITLDKAFEQGGGVTIDLVFDEENETLTAGYLGTFFKVKEFELPANLNGIYVNEEDDEIEVDKEHKTVTKGDKTYTIINYEDESLTLIDDSGNIIEMTYDTTNDALTYEEDVYSKKTGDDEKIKLPESLTGTYVTDDESSKEKIEVLRDDLKLNYTDSTGEVEIYDIVGYNDNKISLKSTTPFVSESVEMTYDKDSDTIHYKDKDFTKKSEGGDEGGEGGGEQGDDPSTTLPEGIDGDYEGEEGKITIDSANNRVTFEAKNGYKMEFDVKSCSSGDIILAGTDGNAQMTYNESDNTITFTTNYDTENKHEYGKFTRVEEGGEDEELTDEDIKKIVNGKYTDNSSREVTVNYPHIVYNRGFLVINYTITEFNKNGTYSAQQDDNPSTNVNGNWDKEKGLTSLSSYTLTKQETETEDPDGPKDPVETETPAIPVPDTWLGNYSSNTGDTLKVENQQVIYTPKGSTAATYKITAVDETSLTVDFNGKDKKLIYDNVNQTLDDEIKQWSKFWFEPENVESLLPDTLNGTYNSGSHTINIDGTTIDVYDGIGSTIVNYHDGVIVLKKSTGFHTTATVENNTIKYKDETYTKQNDAAAANISAMSELFIIDKAVAPIAYPAFKKN